MARMLSRALEMPTSVAAGAATEVSDLTAFEVQVAGTFMASYTIQGSNDLVSWTDIDSFTNSGGVLIIDTEWAWLRANCTSYTSGTPDGAVGGRKQRKKILSMPVPASSPSAGTAVAVYDMHDGLSLQVGGTLSGTVQLQGSMDGSTWTQVGADISSPGQFDVLDPWTFLRVKRTVNGGTTTAVLCGRRVPRNPASRALDTLSNPTGFSALVSDMDSMKVFTQGLTTGNFDLQVSVDGANYASFDTISADGVTDISTSTLQRVRIHWNTYQSGVLVVVVGNLPVTEIPS